MSPEMERFKQILRNHAEQKTNAIALWDDPRKLDSATPRSAPEETAPQGAGRPGPRRPGGRVPPVGRKRE